MNRVNKDSNNYKQQVFDYANSLVKEKLKKKGKYVEDEEKVYVIYARKSTKGKKRQERSIPDQIKDCQKLAKKLKVKPRYIFKEKETAKIPGKRDVFYEMLSGISHKRFNSIITYHPDRLARNMKDAGEIIDLLDKGIIVDLKFATYTFVNDANGILTLAIQFALAKQYSDNLSMVSQRGSYNIAKEGKAPLKRPKYGYKIDQKRYFRPDGENFRLIRKAFTMALEEYPLEEIADYLNKNNFCFDGKKTKITKQKLSKIFQDTFFAGFYIYGSEVVDLKKVDFLFKPVVSCLEFLQLRKVLKDKLVFKRSDNAKTILFSKMVYCGYCGNLMSPGKPRSSGKGGHRYLTLRCNNKDCRTRLDKTLKRGLRGKVIFRYISDLLSSGLELDKKAYEAYKKESKKVFDKQRKEFLSQLKSILRQISEINKTIDIKTRALANASGDLIDKLNQEIKELEIDKKKLETEKKEINQNIEIIDYNLKAKIMSYEKFLNFFKYLDNTIKTSENRYLVDKVIRMIFLNFTIKNQKVVSYQLNPNFEKYIKIPSVLSSRSGRT
jgi:site-specific DNA recombinase